MRGHMLVIKSLRDLEATCLCGRWTLVSPTFDSQSNEDILERARYQYRLHLGDEEILERARHQQKGAVPRGPIND